jgi:hypothetical protein
MIVTKRFASIAGLAFFIFQVILVVMYTENVSRSATTLGGHAQQKKKNLGEYIVRKGYGKSYAIFDKFCRQGETFQQCITKFHSGSITKSSAQLKGANLVERDRFPWWFKTMLRDMADPSSRMFASFHVVKSESPALMICSIAKVASSEWADVGCKLNKGAGSKDCNPPSERELPSETPRAVFLRDPLERFLSGFLDKCIDTDRRYREKHCEPNVVFRSDFINRTRDNPQDLVGELLKDSHIMFDAYVDTIALKWNIHFFPESFYCGGLFRQIDDYDFVGRMGTNFYSDLQTLGRRHGDSLTSTFEKVFKVDLHSENFTRITGNSNAYVGGRERKAAQLLQDYYTPRTVRRVLGYMAIDYVKLGLPIPAWAEEMLQKEQNDYYNVDFA